MPTRFPGVRKEAGFVFNVPLSQRDGIKSIQVQSAHFKVAAINPNLFHVIIPSNVPYADQWEVYVKDGVLKIKPPKSQQGIKVKNVVSGYARVGIMAAVVNTRDGRIPMPPPQLPTIGLVLPREDMPVTN